MLFANRLRHIRCSFSKTKWAYACLSVPAKARHRRRAGRGILECNEILTLFYGKTDSEYFQGKKNENNRKTLLPYNKRYMYVSMTDEVVEKTKSDDTAYVIHADDEQYSDDNEYGITQDGDYCAVTEMEELCL